MKSVIKNRLIKSVYFLGLFIVVSGIFFWAHGNYATDPNAKGWMRHGKAVPCDGVSAYQIEYGFPLVDTHDEANNACSTYDDPMLYTPEVNYLALGINYVIWIAVFHYIIKTSRRLGGKIRSEHQ